MFEPISLGKPPEKQQVLAVRLSRLLDEHLEVAVVLVLHAHDRPSDRVVPAVDRPSTRHATECHHGCRGPDDPDTNVWGVASACDHHPTQGAGCRPYKPAPRYALNAQLRAKFLATAPSRGRSTQPS
jgi:hypothetical protein